MKSCLNNGLMTIISFFKFNKKEVTLNLLISPIILIHLINVLIKTVQTEYDKILIIIILILVAILLILEAILYLKKVWNVFLKNNYYKFFIIFKFIIHFTLRYEQNKAYWQTYDDNFISGLEIAIYLPIYLKLIPNKLIRIIMLFILLLYLSIRSELIFTFEGIYKILIITYFCYIALFLSNIKEQKKRESNSNSKFNIIDQSNSKVLFNFAPIPSMIELNNIHRLSTNLGSLKSMEENILNNMDYGIILIDSNINLLYNNLNVFKIFPPDWNHKNLLENILSLSEDESFSKFTNFFEYDHDQVSKILNLFRHKMEDSKKYVCSELEIITKKRLSLKSYRSLFTMFNSKELKTNKTLNYSTVQDVYKYNLNRNSAFSKLNDYEKKSTEINTVQSFLQNFLKFRSLYSLKSKQVNSLNSITNMNDDYPNEIYVSYNKEIYHLSFQFLEGEELNKKIMILIKKLNRKSLVYSFIENHYSKTNLFASISHELRTPLNSIMYMLEAMENNLKRETGNKHDEYFNILFTNSNLLLCNINDFLDYYMITLNSFKLELEECDLEKIFIEAMKICEPSAAKKKLSIFMDFDSFNIPKPFYTDSKRLLRVVLNLLNNSIRHTATGYVAIEVKPTLKYKNLMECIVMDSGSGVDDSVLNSIGSIFKKNEKNKNICSGFGLFISNYNVNCLGPKKPKYSDLSGIFVNSKKDQGTKMKFYLRNFIKKEIISKENVDFSPLRKTSQAIEEFKNNHDLKFKSLSQISKLDSYPELNIKTIEISKSLSIINEDNSCKCKKVLIVDDTIFNIFVLQSMLNSFNILSESANDGVEAIELIKKALNDKNKFCSNCKFYKLILMDIEMPRKNGIETSKDLNKLFNENKLNVNIVAVSAFESSQYRDQSLEAGIKQYLLKPITKEILEKVLLEYL